MHDGFDGDDIRIVSIAADIELARHELDDREPKDPNQSQSIIHFKRYVLIQGSMYIFLENTRI